MPRLGNAAGLYGASGGKGRSPWNIASGGTETTVANYNGTGQTWKVHTLSNTQVLSVTKSGLAFTVLVVGGGGSGSGTEQSRGGCGGGGGAYTYNTSASFAVGSFTATIGGTSSISSYSAAGGSNGLGIRTSGNELCGGASGNGFAGGRNSASSFVGGGGGGAAGAGASGDAGSSGGAAYTSTITGTSASYGRGGNGGGQSQNGSSGQAGTVIVAYRTG